MGISLNRTHLIAFSFATAMILAGGPFCCPAQAQNITSKLSTSAPLGDVDSGQYRAGDRLDFALVEEGSRYLLKFADQDEVFVLSADRGSAGGRLLKYDSGAIAVQVAGWGGLTLYPANAPNGLPVERVGEAVRPIYETISFLQIQNDAETVGQALNVTIAVNWDLFAGDAVARTIGDQTLKNFERGAQQFIAQRGRAAFSQRVETIRLEPNMRPSLVLAGKTLMVGFNQSQGFAGRLSSRSVTQTLNGLLPK